MRTSISVVAASLCLGGISSAQSSAAVDSAHITATLQPSANVPTPAPPSNLVAKDTPNDDGHSVDLSWQPSPSETAGLVKRYAILRATGINGQPNKFAEVGRVAAGVTAYQDDGVSPDSSYYYRVAALNDTAVAVQPPPASESAPAGPIQATAQWFDWQRINTFVGMFLLSAFIIFYIARAKAGKSIFIRKIAGLEAVEEAVGRATEMGRQIYYIPGSSDMDNVQTIAAITILGRVAELAAQFETGLQVPVSRSLVMVTAREVVKEAYAKVGRPDSFKEDQVRYLTDDQFGYAAAIDGMVVREKPATIFLLGNFYAEALILAETGNSVGAIQIAGTGEPSQLPFFVAACDYTLIGEELFAASAYLSREPRQLGSLKGQDIGKGVVLVAIVVGIILETFHIFHFAKLFRVIG